jgi:hypothetical protein
VGSRPVCGYLTGDLDLVEVWWVLQTIMTLFGHCGLYQDLTAT